MEERWLWTVETPPIGESNENETVLERENRSFRFSNVRYNVTNFRDSIRIPDTNFRDSIRIPDTYRRGGLYVLYNTMRTT